MMIAINEVVRVESHAGQVTIAHRAKVLGIPCATGDSWRFENLDTGETVYVSEGCTITKAPENSNHD